MKKAAEMERGLWGICEEQLRSLGLLILEKTERIPHFSLQLLSEDKRRDRHDLSSLMTSDKMCVK